MEFMVGYPSPFSNKIKMRFKIFFSGLLLFFQSFLFAHNPSQSSLKLSIYEQSGILEINLAEYGVEQALLKKYPDLDLKSIVLKDYKELIINYLKENINIAVNGQQLKIGKGAIKLGGHQTDLKFQIDNIPQDPQYVDVYAPCFKENEKQQNFFRIIYRGMTVKKKAKPRKQLYL